MAEPSPLDPLRETLADLARVFAAARVEGVVIGGVAASLLGRPRATRDVDALVWLAEDRWADLLATAEHLGFEARVSDALAFARRARVLLLRHARSRIDLDVAFGALPFEEEAIRRRIRRSVGGVEIDLPAPEDLVVMKAVAHRPRDAADIEGLLDANPGLDRARVRQWVRAFADALEAPELAADLEALLRKVP